MKLTTLTTLTTLITLTCLLQFSTLGGYAEDSKDPLADIKSQLKDPAKPFTLIVEFSIKPEHVKEWRKLVQDSVKQTKQEPGCVTYTCHQDAKDPNKFVFVEVWRSMAAIEFHVQQEYVKSLLGKAGELGSAPPNIRVLTPWVPAPPKPKDEGAPAKPTDPAVK